MNNYILVFTSIKKLPNWYRKFCEAHHAPYKWHKCNELEEAFNKYDIVARYDDDDQIDALTSIEMNHIIYLILRLKYE